MVNETINPGTQHIILKIVGFFDPSVHPYFPGSNLILKGALDDYGSGNPINFASWMQYATIPMIINFFLCWLWLQMFYLGLPKKCSISRKSCNAKVNVFLVGPWKMANKTPKLNLICITFPPIFEISFCAGCGYKCFISVLPLFKILFKLGWETQLNRTY